MDYPHYENQIYILNIYSITGNAIYSSYYAFQRAHIISLYNSLLLPHKCVVMYNKIPLMTIEVIPIPAHIIILYELNLLLKFITGDEKMQIS